MGLGMPNVKTVQELALLQCLLHLLAFSVEGIERRTQSILHCFCYSAVPRPKSTARFNALNPVSL